MRPLPDRHSFTTAQAIELGLSPSSLKHAVRTGVLLHPRRGVYLRADAPPETAATAVAQTIARSVISHRSAVLLHGLPLIGRQPVVPELTLPPGSSGDHPGIHLYRAALRPRDIVDIRGALTTSPARTCIDAARHVPLDSAVAVIDAALHRGLVRPAELEDQLRFCWNWPGIRRAQRAVALADGRAESPLESISRLVIPRLGFPAPDLQRCIFDREGRLVGRSDFYWDEFGVVGEADGRLKYREDDAFPLEKIRQEAFEDLGLVVARWGWVHARHRHDVLQRKLGWAIERAGRRDRSGLPRLWTL